MKNVILLITIFILTAVLSGAGIYYWKNFRGSETAFRKPTQNIANILPSSNQIQQIENQKPGENKTNLPLKVPAGFSISVFAKNLPDARVIAPDIMGNIWVSRPDANVVTLLEISDGKLINQSDTLRNLNKPHGLAFDPDQPTVMYIGEANKITRVSLYSEGLPAGQAGNYEKIVDLPMGGRHTTRTLLMGPDGKIYVHIGSACDVCVESDKRRGTIYVLNRDGSDFYEFASGLRNSVFMTLHPVTKEIWATEMGRDFLGDNLPPDEVNIIKERNFYGWPYCFGNKVQDKTFSTSDQSEQLCRNSEPAKIDIQAHSAPLGLAFFPESPDWPEEYWNNLLVAYHGSWNRSIPTGYKIVRYKLDHSGNMIGQEDFITGWLTDSGALGRPVDIKIQSDGKIYISDDKAGAVYLAEYQK